MLQTLGLYVMWAGIIVFGVVHGFDSSKKSENDENIVLTHDESTLLFTVALMILGAAMRTMDFVNATEILPQLRWISFILAYTIAGCGVGLGIEVLVAYCWTPRRRPVEVK